MGTMENDIVSSRDLSQITKLEPPGGGGGTGGQQWTSGKGHSCLQTLNSKGPNSGVWGGTGTMGTMENGIVASRDLSQITKLEPPGGGGRTGSQQWTSGKGHSCLQTLNSKGPNSGAWGTNLRGLGRGGEHGKGL